MGRASESVRRCESLEQIFLRSHDKHMLSLVPSILPCMIHRCSPSARWFRRSPFHGWVLWFSTSLFWASIPFWEVLIHGNGWSACTGWFWVLVLEDTGVTSKPDILKHDWYKLERLRLWGKLSVVQHPFFDSDNMLIWELSVEFGIWQDLFLPLTEKE